MTEGRPATRRRRHPALGARVASTGIGVAAVLGIVGGLGASARGDEPDPATSVARTDQVRVVPVGQVVPPTTATFGAGTGALTPSMAAPATTAPPGPGAPPVDPAPTIAADPGRAVVLSAPPDPGVPEVRTTQPPTTVPVARTSGS